MWIAAGGAALYFFSRKKSVVTAQSLPHYDPSAMTQSVHEDGSVDIIDAGGIDPIHQLRPPTHEEQIAMAIAFQEAVARQKEAANRHGWATTGQEVFESKIRFSTFI